MRSARAGIIPALCLLFLLVGCAYMRPVAKPMLSRIWEYDGQADTLIVMLPGLGDSALDFRRHGFVDALWEAGVAADVQAMDIHVRHYMGGQFADRLQHEVIEPARAKGYRSIWVAGISLGGFGALVYAQDYADNIDGIVTIAPFLGNGEIPQEIQRAGGLDPWVQNNHFKPNDQMRKPWLGAYQAVNSDLVHHFWHVWGAADKYAVQSRYLATYIPPGQTIQGPGAHNWTAWRRLWKALVRVVPWQG